MPDHGAIGYLGRQPIYNARREIRAYELLYRRSASESSATILDANRASAEVMLKAFVEIGMSSVSPQRPVFVNFPEHLLAGEPIIPPDRCVVEVLENVEASQRVVGLLRELKRRNYRIALDDFEYREELTPFLELADYVKVDVRAVSRRDLHEYPSLLRKFGVQLVAEKIESEAEFEECRNLGFELFQGYYLRKPETMSGRHIPANRLSVLSLLAKCVEPGASAGDIAAVTARDVTLTYGLLRLANSALYGRSAEISTPQQAVALLGMDTVLRWTSLLLLAGHDDCPMGYLELALQRARTAELVAAGFDCRAYEAYMVGLLSTLDAILNVPMEEIVEPLPLAAPFKSALASRQGALGRLLSSVLAYESCRLEAGAEKASDVDALEKAFWQAGQYASTMLENLKAMGRP